MKRVMIKGVIFSFTMMMFSQMALAFDEQFKFLEGQRSSKDIELDESRKGPQIATLAEIKPGMIVADVLGGSGYYSEILSDLVGPSGKVYLHNNNAYMPYVEKELVARLANERLKNVIRHDRETDDLDFGAEQFDAIFFILGYHDLYHKAQGWDIDKPNFLGQLKRALKIGGKLVIVDHSAKQGTGTEHSQDLHRIDKDYVIKELSTFGFELIEQSELLANSQDDRMISPFNPTIRRKTDRFVLVFNNKRK
ncbi:class I SAM-dependent methyltransferase [Thalassotalea ganghwensis]